MEDFSVTEVGADKETVKAAIDRHPEIPNAVRSALFAAIDACENTAEGQVYTATADGTFTCSSISISIDLLKS